MSNEPARIDGRARRASWRQAAGVRPTRLATASKGKPKMSWRMNEVCWRELLDHDPKCPTYLVV
jgi:hypothetical protein